MRYLEEASKDNDAVYIGKVLWCYDFRFLHICACPQITTCFSSFSGMVDTILNAIQVICLLILIAVKAQTRVFQNAGLSETGSQFHDGQQETTAEARDQETQTPVDGVEISCSNQQLPAPEQTSSWPASHTWPLMQPAKQTRGQNTLPSTDYLYDNAVDGWRYLGQTCQGWDTVH